MENGKIPSLGSVGDYYWQGKTAKALGITIPQSILLRADKVVQ